MKLHISPGNTKLGPIPSFSLPPVWTCPGCTELCARICYAKLVYTRYKRTRACWNGNFEAVKVRTWEDMMIHHIHCLNTRLFRIHVGGDFFSQEYLDGWIKVCAEFPDIQFVAFTKSFDLDYSAAPGNLNIIWSVFPDSDFESIPDGPRAYTLIPGHEYPEGLLCDAVRCAGGCVSCGICFYSNSNGLNMAFDAHGGVYSQKRKGDKS